MKIFNKQLKKVFITAPVIGILVTLMPIKVSAAADNYSFTANWNDSTCSGTINGQPGITNETVDTGDTVNVVVTNQSPDDLLFIFAFSSGNGDYYKEVSPEGTYSTSLTNFQGNVGINATPNTTPEHCEGTTPTGTGPGGVSITAITPAPVPTATPVSTPSTTPSSSVTTPKSNSTPNSTDPASTTTNTTTSTAKSTTVATPSATTSNTTLLTNPPSPKLKSVDVSKSLNHVVLPTLLALAVLAIVGWLLIIYGVIDIRHSKIGKLLRLKTK